MAWLERRSGLYRIAFRYGGRKLQHSLKTEDSDEAQRCLARFEENLRLLERGRLELPPGVDLGLFLHSDGKVSKKPTLASSLTLEELFKRYEKKLPEGSKEENTRSTERIHIKHLTRIIGARVVAHTLTPETLQSYVDKRALEKGRNGDPLSHATIKKEITTIKKEITTLASIWNRWAVPQGLVTGPAPTRGLIYRKGRPKPPFQTFEQIKVKIAREALRLRGRPTIALVHSHCSARSSLASYSPSQNRGGLLHLLHLKKWTTFRRAHRAFGTEFPYYFLANGSSAC